MLTPHPLSPNGHLRAGSHEACSCLSKKEVGVGPGRHREEAIHSPGASRFSHSSDLASPLGLKLPFCVNLLDMVAAVTTALRLRLRLGTFCSGWKRMM